MDDPLFDELRRAAEAHDPVPERMLTAAEAAYTFRTFEAELAELVFDSHEAAQLVRGSGGRILTFRWADGALELEAIPQAGALRLIGQLSPARATDIELCTPDAAVTVTSDELGRFAALVTPPRPFLLRLDSVQTEWVSP